MSLPYEIRDGVRDRMHGYVHQVDAVLSQVNPVSATLYTVLNTTAFVRILSAVAQVTWTVQPNPLDIVITIDGNLPIHSKGNPVSATPYGLGHHIADDFYPLANCILTNIYDASLLVREYEGKNIKVEARTTGGTVQNLDARVKWAQRQVYQ